MPTVQKAIPAQRRGTAALPWFTGDVTAIAARLRAEASVRVDGDCVQAVIFIEAIQEEPKLSAPRKAHLTAAVLEAVQLVRGWAAPLAEPVDHPFAALDRADEQPAPGPADLPAEQSAPDPDGVEALTAQLQHAEADRPEGSCVQAIVLIEAIHCRDVTPAEMVRLTGVVLAAVRAARGWMP
jgi:hypothetical protein